MKKNKVFMAIIIFINVVLVGFMFLCARRYEFLTVSSYWYLLCALLFTFIPTYLAILVYFILKKLYPKLNRVVHFILSLLLFVVVFLYTGWHCLYCIITNLCSDSPFYSETHDIKNYLVVDSNLYWTYVISMQEFLPTKDLAMKNGQDYFYWYQDGLDYYDFEIYLEVKLTEEEYQQEKERVMNLEEGIELVDSHYYKGRKDYVIHEVTAEKDLNFNYKFASFSDEELSIRYVWAFSFDGYGDYYPLYFLTKK